MGELFILIEGDSILYIVYNFDWRYSILYKAQIYLKKIAAYYWTFTLFLIQSTLFWTITLLHIIFTNICFALVFFVLRSLKLQSQIEVNSWRLRTRLLLWGMRTPVAASGGGWRSAFSVRGGQEELMLITRLILIMVEGEIRLCTQNHHFIQRVYDIPYWSPPSAATRERKQTICEPGAPASPAYADVWWQRCACMFVNMVWGGMVGVEKDGWMWCVGGLGGVWGLEPRFLQDPAWVFVCWHVCAWMLFFLNIPSS